MMGNLDAQPEPVGQEPVWQVIGYHQATKHHFFRYAKSLGYLDWANQPDPFRRYDGAPFCQLPLLDLGDEPRPPGYDDLYVTGAVDARPLGLTTISRFFDYALSLTAWKEAGGVRWALRSNPSSGNLHPTEGYLLIGEVPGLPPGPGLYHYAPREHGLERRASWPPDRFASVMGPFPPGAFLVAFTSIHWREAWKYGERAYRYCQHDVGHAIGTARIAAATLGWRMVLLDDVGDDALAGLLGLDRAEDYAGAEREDPDCVVVVWPRSAGQRVDIPLAFEPAALTALPGVRWHGKANRLSRQRPDPWEIIDVVAAATRKPPVADQRERRRLMASPDASEIGRVKPQESVHQTPMSAGQIIRQRRSALAFDGKTGLSREGFFRMLGRTVPSAARSVLDRLMPWDACPWEPTIHLALFVHRVEGLPPGLYCVVRHPAKTADLRAAMHPQFLWSRPMGCPDALPLFLLQEGDARKLAAQLSCHQEIAGDGAFSLGMVAEFEGALSRMGAWFYRRLFWEAGVLGQVLYLEAEATGLRATGIGCFFDDPVHQAFGYQDTSFQSLYHFTIGGPLDDPRLTTLPAYGHLKTSRQG